MVNKYKLCNWCSPPPPPRIYDVMGEVNTNWFKAKLKEVGISQRRLAVMIGLDPASVSNMLLGKRRISMDEATRMAGVLQVPVTEVMRQAGIEVLDDVKKVPIAGYIGTGAVVTILPNGTHDHAMAPADVPRGSYALQLRMVNSPRDGWLYFVSGTHFPPADCVDKLCVCALKDGTLMPGQVMRGYKRDLYNLMLLTKGDEVLENREIVWAAPVLWIQPQ